MPDTLPTEDASARFDLGPLGIERVTAMTKPLRSELPGPAMGAALHHQSIVAQAFPIRRRQAVRFGDRNGQARRKIRVRCVAHSVASEPRRRLLAGVTIGSPITMATSLRGTWLVEVPRT